MKRNTTGVVVLSSLIAVCLLAGEAVGEDSAPTYDIRRFYQELRQVMRRHYPQATSHQLGSKIHFEHDTRIFIVHEAYKTGQWQDPWEERGPKKDGVLVDIEILPGRYMGAAAVPQSFDKRYFTLLLLAPYSESLDAHLYVHIRYPARPPEGFLKQLTEVMNDFGKYVSRVEA